MTIVACPKCADSVVLPGRASHLATVRCPLCQAEFPLAELLDKLPPALIVVHDPQAAASQTAPENLIAPALAGSEVAGGFAPLSIETDASRSPETAAPRGRRPPARAKRKPKNPVMEGVKIVLGGVAGLAIAQVILWWLGSSQSWPRQRADMFELAPKVARFVPWIVPERYRGEKPASDAADASPQDVEAVARGTVNSENAQPQGLPQRTFVDPNTDSGAGGAGKAVPAKTKKSGRSPDRKRPDMPESRAPFQDGTQAADGAAAKQENDLTEVPETDAERLEEMKLDAEMLPDDQPLADPVVSPAVEPENKPGAEPNPGAEALPKVPRTTAAELRSAVDEARTVVDALKAAPEADSRSLLRQAYEALAKLGETAAFRAPSDEAELPAAVDLLKSVIAEDQKLNTLGKAAGGWLKAAARDNNGVLLVGTVKQVRKQGGYFVTELVIPGRDQPVAVYSAAEPGEAYASDTRLVVLGAIITSPYKELVGYEGDGDLVVWEGLAEKLPPP